MSNQRKKSSISHSAVIAQGRSGNQAPKASSFRYYIMISLVVLFTIGVIYSVWKFVKVTEFSATRLFGQAFLEPASSVTDLSGDQSKSLVGFDSWIRFKTPKEVHLRREDEFKPYLSEVGRSAFSAKYANDQSLHQPPSDYDYMVRTEHTVGKVVNEAVLINKSTHEYFYREWGM